MKKKGWPSYYRLQQFFPLVCLLRAVRQFRSVSAQNTESSSSDTSSASRRFFGVFKFPQEQLQVQQARRQAPRARRQHHWVLFRLLIGFVFRLASVTLIDTGSLFIDRDLAQTADTSDAVFLYG